MRQFLTTLSLVGLLAASVASAERRPDADWKRPGIPDGSALGAALDAAIEPLRAGGALEERTLVYVRPDRVIWDDREPRTQVVVQDARIERDPEIEVEKGGVSVASILLLGIPIRETRAVVTGALEVEGKLVFLETPHELVIEGVLPTGGVLPLWIEPTGSGRYRRLVAVRGPGPDGIDGVAPQVLPSPMKLANVGPLIHSLELPSTSELTNRRWRSLAARGSERGTTSPGVSSAMMFLDGLDAGEPSHEALFGLAEAALREQLALRDSAVDRLSLTRVLAQTDRLEEARAHLEPLAAELPYQPEVSVELAMLAAEIGDPALAFRLLTPALEDPAQPVVAQAVCARLQQQSPDSITCPQREAQTADALDVDFEDLLAQGEDTPSFEPVARVVIETEMSGELLAALRVVSHESAVEHVRVEFEVTIREGHESAEVLLEFNPPGAGWIRRELAPGADPLVRTFSYRHPSPEPKGVYWHLWAQEGKARENVGTRAEPLDLESRQLVVRP